MYLKGNNYYISISMFCECKKHLNSDEKTTNVMKLCYSRAKRYIAIYITVAQTFAKKV